MFRRGDRVRVSESINAIPAGVYKFIEQIGEMLFFSCGPGIQFGISSDCLPLLKRVEKCTTLTTPSEYLPAYFRLLDTLREIPFNPSTPFTFCAMDPRNPGLKMRQAPLMYDRWKRLDNLQ